MKKGLLLIGLFVSFVGIGQCPTGPIVLSYQHQVDDFKINYPNCTHLSEYLGINSDVTNLNGLSNLISIDTFNINSCNDLENLEGLENLEHVNYFLIQDNWKLSSISSLSSLTSVEHLEIDFNNNLVDLSGLENLETVSKKLIFSNLSSLTSLHGLENLESVGDEMEISWNNALTSIDAINNMNPTSFRIYLNGNLSKCAVQPVCEQIGVDPSRVFIANNKPNCNSVSEIEAQCQLSITEADLSENLSLFPNPVSSILNIEISKTISFQKTIIYSTLGKRILETSEKQINLETLSSGIYFVEVVTDMGSVTKKIVKE